MVGVVVCLPPAVARAVADEFCSGRDSEGGFGGCACLAGTFGLPRLARVTSAGAACRTPLTSPVVPSQRVFPGQRDEGRKTVIWNAPHYVSE